MQPDPLIIKGCVNGDQKSQHLLYKECYSFFFGICFRYVKKEDEAAALMNQGFLKVLNNLHLYNPQIPFTAWSRRIMVNTIIDGFRSNKKHKVVDSVDFVTERKFDSAMQPYREVPDSMDMEIVEKAIAALPEPSGSVFNMFVIDGFSHQEIADKLKMSVGTSKWHLSKARGILKERIGKLFISV
ncbi:MAG: sigma-70 family RNA polymerase sigma factor [Saprospiraceae bacterium]|jgi:RNA polymerase sigma factor (sigma-70 family)|nr:sigma-70 family RNA polymerase sigma factor [Saprospiraceae bacterium]